MIRSKLDGRGLTDRSERAKGMSENGRRRPFAIALVKSLHTAIFAVELAAITWLVVSGLLGRRDRTVAVAAAAVAAEATVFVMNDRVCPLTPLAERMGSAHGSVSDIFLPDAVARTIPIWSTALLTIAAVLHARPAIRSARRVARERQTARRASAQ